MSVNPNLVCRLEVHNGVSWVNVTGPTSTIEIDRNEADMSNLAAEVLDADLDPVEFSTVRPGHAVRVQVLSQDFGTARFEVSTGGYALVFLDGNPDGSYDFDWGNGIVETYTYPGPLPYPPEQDYGDDNFDFPLTITGPDGYEATGLIPVHSGVAASGPLTVATEFVDVFNGKVNDVSVTRNPLAKSGRAVNVKLDVVDVVSAVANIPERRGVEFIDDLRWLYDGRGFAFNVNGETTGLGSGTEVAGNDNANLWDQTLITRDTQQGYAWVDKAGAVNVFDLATIETTIVATIGPENYFSLDTGFDLEQVINSVVVNWLRYNIGTEQSAPVPYGPYDDVSVGDWGERRAEFTIQGATELEANISAWAEDVLDHNAVPEVRPRSCVIPMRTVADLELVRAIDLNSRVTVIYHDGVTEQEMRIVGIKHEITSDDGGSWTVTLRFAMPEGLTVPSSPAGSPTAYIPDGSITTDMLDPDLSGGIFDALALATAALAAAEDAMDFAETKNQVFRQTTAPSGGPFAVDDLWFDTNDGNKMYAWSGSAWVDATGSWLISNPSSSFPNVVISPAGLAAYDAGGTLVTSISSTTGAISTIGPVLTGGDISGATVTGGVVQTTATASRGIKINSTGLAAYDGAGNPTFTVIAATGAVAMLGSLTAGSTIVGSTFTGGLFQTGLTGDRIVMSNALAAQIQFEFGAGGSAGGIGILSGPVIQIASGIPSAMSFGSSVVLIPGSASTASPVTGSMPQVQIGGSLKLPDLVAGGSANMHADASGYIYRVTSSARYKENVDDLEIDLAAFRSLRPKQFNRIGWDTLEAGFIAEEVHDLGLTKFVEYDLDGNPDSVTYPTITVALHAAHLDHEERLRALEEAAA